MSKKKKEVESTPVFCFIDYSKDEFGVLITDERCLKRLNYSLIDGTEEEDDYEFNPKPLKEKVMKALTDAGLKVSKKYEKMSN